MTDGNYELSRRKILAGMGAVGVAGAASGLGTSAFFSDQETFTNNRMVAGSLDLKVDWEEHYSDWSEDEDDDPENGTLDIQMEEPGNPDLYRRFPAGATDETVGEHGLWVLREDVPQFMNNTAIDALPDMDNDGTGEFPVEEMAEMGETVCSYLADVGADDDGLSSDLRTNDAGDVTNPGDPLINLQDVKPGDFGEVTFSTHLCAENANPGYLWMNMPGGLEASENGVVEPEADDADEDQNEDGSLKQGEEGPAEVELVDEIQTALWYDTDCDNLPDREGQPIDLLAIADISGSIDSDEMDTIETAANEFVKQLPTDGTVQAGFMTFNGPGEGFAIGDPEVGITLEAEIGGVDRYFVNNDPTEDADVGQFLPEEGVGSTPMPAALSLARQYINAAARPNSQKVILLVTDGGPDYPNETYEISTPEGGFSFTTQDGSNNGVSSIEEQNETADEADDIDDDDIVLFTVAVGTADNPQFEGSQSLASYLETEIAKPTTNEAFDATLPGNTLTGIATTVAGRISTLAGTGGGEKPIFTGTLGELEDVLTANNGRGIPLDADATPTFDELETENEQEDSDARDCFLPGVTYCFGFSWWLPLNHGNEVQTDSVSFDIGFYTEQCRHNDGGGIV
ncbi:MULTISPECIES: vWA domain-containing protein [Salinibaculum]|uniref:vWA domain-containing protein n=1 Tax=Salinibaculum TaxID=2732368 RepID=UPI0030CE66B9